MNRNSILKMFSIEFKLTYSPITTLTITKYYKWDINIKTNRLMVIHLFHLETSKPASTQIPSFFTMFINKTTN